jgi:hypothetical protein
MCHDMSNMMKATSEHVATQVTRTSPSQDTLYNCSIEKYKTLYWLAEKFSDIPVGIAFFLFLSDHHDLSADSG